MLPQGPNAGSTGAGPGTPGGVAITIAAPVDVGVEGTLSVARTGGTTAALGGFSTLGSCVWLGLATAPASTNYTLLGAPSLGLCLFRASTGAGQAIIQLTTDAGATLASFGTGPAADRGSCLNGQQVAFGGGVGVCEFIDATTEPTGNITTGTVFWSFTNGAFKTRSAKGFKSNLAALGTGTLNTQAVFVDTFSAVVRTVSSATPTAFGAYTTLSNTIGWIDVRLKSKAATSGTGVAVGDGAFAEYRLGYKNVAGTVTLATAGITLVGSVQTTAVALTATLTAAASGATVVISVTNVNLATIDSQIDCTIDVA
jgi:hypothetical protein